MIVFDQQIPLIQSALSDHSELYAVNGRHITNELLRSTKATALIVRSTTHVNEALLMDTDVQFVASATSGIDHIDVEHLIQNNITFFYAAGSNAPAVVDYVTECIHHFTPTSSFVLGIVGHGHVGSLLRRQCVENGITVLVNDPPLLTQGELEADGALVVEDLEDLLRGSDIVSLHVPLTLQEPFATHHLIDTHQLLSMKSNGLLINTSRGGVVNESAYLSLQQKRPSLILDVFEDEPSPSKEILNLCTIATPHIGGYTTSAKVRGAQMVLAAYADHSGLELDVPVISSRSGDAVGRLESPFKEMWRDGYGAQEFDALRAEYLGEH